MFDLKSISRVRRRISNVALRYYLALRVSAAVATPTLFSLENYRQPAPIVRTQQAQMIGRWDARECIVSGDDHYIITTTLDLASGDSPPTIGEN